MKIKTIKYKSGPNSYEFMKNDIKYLIHYHKTCSKFYLYEVGEKNQPILRVVATLHDSERLVNIGKEINFKLTEKESVQIQKLIWG